jgi:hypothetical protein
MSSVKHEPATEVSCGPRKGGMNKRKKTKGRERVIME